MKNGELVDTSKLVKLSQSDALNSGAEYSTFHKYKVRPHFIKLFDGEYIVTGRKKNEVNEYLVDIFPDCVTCTDELKKIIRRV